jgi:CRP/FNR family transcriptional regulator, nitrogen oxide reductase regulator
MDQTAANGPLFMGLSEPETRAVLAEARPHRYSKGSAVFEQGQDAQSFFLLTEGHLRVTRLTPDGQQIVVRYISPGEPFGVAMAIGQKHYPGTATAVVDSMALAWPTATWPRLVAAHPQLAANAMQLLGGRLQDANARLVEMSTQQVERRVAHALLRLAQQSGRKTETGILIDFPISRQDVAEMTGATLHTVSRVMSAWEEKGLVESGRQRIVLVDPHRLMLLAEGD